MTTTLILIVLAYAVPHRAPDELLESSLPDAHVRIWQGIRACQSGAPGTNAPPTHYPLSYIAKRCAKSENAVSKALIPLKAFGWIEQVGREGKTLLLRCHVGREYRSKKGEYVGLDAADILPDGKVDPACEEGCECAFCLTGRFNLPDGKVDPACEEETPTPPYKESSCQDPVIHLENNNTSSYTGEGGGQTNAASVVVLSEGSEELPDPDRPAKIQAFRQLEARGVAEPVAIELARDHWRHVHAVVRDFDRRREAGLTSSVGWLVTTVRAYVPPKPKSPAKQAATHTGELPEAQRSRQLRIADRDAPTADPSVVAAAHAEIERAKAEADRQLEERAERIAEERKAKRRGLQPTPAEVSAR